MKEILVNLFNVKLFSGPSGTLTIAFIAFLIFGFLFYFGWYLVPLFFRLFLIQSNYRSTSRIKKKNADYREMRGKIQSRLFKKPLWANNFYNNYWRTWQESRLKDTEKAVYPIRLREFLTPETVIDSVINRRIADALPGIFITLGIFGTFLGLVIGLGDIKLDQGVDNLNKSISNLISGLSMAFYTSLVGIILSIAFSVLYRYLLKHIEKAVLKLDELLFSIFPCQSNEQYMRKYFEVQFDIKQGLQTLATDVATKISDTIAPAMDQALVSHLVPIMQDLQAVIKNSIEESKAQQIKILNNFGGHIEKMSSVITDNFENSQKKQSEAMEGVLGQYVEKMNETFLTQFKDMGKIIEETTRVQSEIKSQMVQFTEQFHRQFEVQTELIEKTSRSGQLLNDSLESLEKVSRELKSSADDIASAASMLEESALKAKEGQDTLRESIDLQINAMTNTREELSKSWNIITANTDSTVQVLREVINELADGIAGQLNNALTAFDSAVAEVVERFSGTLFETSQTIEELPSLIIKMNENFDAIRSNMTAQKDILSDLRNTTRDIVAPNIEKAAETSRELTDTSRTITETSIDLHNWFNSIKEYIRLSGETIESKARESFNEVDKISNDFLTRLSNGMKLLESDGPFHSSIAELNSSLRQMQQQTENNSDGIKSSFEKLDNNLNALVENIEKIKGGNGNISEELSQGVKVIAENVIPRFKELNVSVNKIAQVVDGIKTSEIQQDSKRGILKGFFNKK